MLLSPGCCCCCCFGSFLYTSFTLLWWDANLVKGHFSRSPTVRMPVGPFAILQYVCHMPQSGVSIYAGTCMRLPSCLCVCVRVNVCVWLCVILMQITFPVFELQLVDTCVRVRLFVSVCVCVCVSVCVLILHADTHLVQNIIQFFWKSQQQTTTTTTGQRAHKCFLSLSRSLSLLSLSLLACVSLHPVSLPHSCWVHICVPLWHICCWRQSLFSIWFAFVNFTMACVHLFC